MKPLMKTLVLTATPGILAAAGSVVLAELQSWPEQLNFQVSFETATRAASQPGPAVEGQVWQGQILEVAGHRP